MKGKSPVSFYFYICTLLLLAALNVGCSDNKAIASQDDEISHFDVTAIASGAVDVEGGLVGVAARKPGVVSEVYVNEGDFVKKGAVLAVMDDTGTKISVQAAILQQENSERELVKAKILLESSKRKLEKASIQREKGFLSQEHYEELHDELQLQQANVSIIESKVESDKVNLAYRQYEDELNIIRAPVDGVVVRRFANPGEGTSTLNVSILFQLEPDANKIVRSEVSEQFLEMLSVNQKVEFWSEIDSSKLYSGKVKRISKIFGARKLKFDDSAAETDQRVVEVIVEYDKAQLLNGQRVMVRFASNS
jgi:HlyD family secretion protein